MDINEFISSFNQTVNNSFQFLDNPVISAGLRLVLLMYAGFAAPRLPNRFADLFDNSLFRVAILFLILWTGSKDPTLSLLIVIGFTVSLNYLTNQRIELYDGLLARDMDLDISREKERTEEQANLNQKVNSGIPEGLSPTSTVLY